MRIYLAINFQSFTIMRNYLLKMWFLPEDFLAGYSKKDKYNNNKSY